MDITFNHLDKCKLLPTFLVIFLGRSQVPVKCPKHLDDPRGAPGKKCPLRSQMGLGLGLISIGRARVGAQRGTCQFPNRFGVDSLLNCGHKYRMNRKRKIKKNIRKILLRTHT